jgi:hypothetical protein
LNWRDGFCRWAPSIKPRVFEDYPWQKCRRLIIV